MASYIYVSLLFILLTNKPFKLVVVEGPSTWHRTFTWHISNGILEHNTIK